MNLKKAAQQALEALPMCGAICRETHRGITRESNCKNYARYVWFGTPVCKTHLNFYKRSAEKRLEGGGKP